MADLLKSGQKMLSLSCPVCNNPIFQSKSGTTFCAICNRKVLLVDETSNKNGAAKKPIEYNPLESIKLDSKINSILIEKINWIAQKLEKENQIPIISEYIDLLLNFLIILEKIKNFNL